MTSFLGKYAEMKKESFRYNLRKAKQMKTCYFFLLPYAVLP